MKKADVIKEFIPISAMDQHKILTKSGINFVNVRTGNRHHSTRNIKIYDRFKDKRNWDTVIYAYNKVEDPRYFNDGRVLETSEIYLNPKYRFLLDFNRRLEPVNKETYINFISTMKGIKPTYINSILSYILAEYIIHDPINMEFIEFGSMPILARKTFEQEEERYYLIETYRTYLKEGYFNG